MPADISSHIGSRVLQTTMCSFWIMVQMLLEQSEEMRAENEGGFTFSAKAFSKLKTFLVLFMWSNCFFNIPLVTLKYLKLMLKGVSVDQAGREKETAL